MTGIVGDIAVSGAGLRTALVAAAAHLRERARAIDAINVYPVPDGDTGSNMSATLQEAVEATLTLGEEPGAGDVLRALAKGALFGARGNSGVILSQALRGLADGVGEEATVDGEALAAGLSAAARAAYGAVVQPTEGTMLTVLRAAGEASLGAAEGHPGVVEVLEAAVRAAEEAEERTPELLPALKEAGVPDSGGEGVCTLLRGLLAALTGRAVQVVSLPVLDLSALEEHDGFGFCTEFLLETGTDQEREGVAAALGLDGYRSVVLVGEGKMFKIHVHADDPAPLLAAAERAGRVSRVKTEDMSAQHRRFEATGSGGTRRVAMLALSPGAGFDALFTSLRAEPLRMRMDVKPAAGDIARAADGMGAQEVVVLPNHSNVVMAAMQAAELTRCLVHVVPTESLPQGVAATLAFDPEQDADTNAARMKRAIAGVRTVEVTVAAAERTADGVAVRLGQAIGLLDGRLVIAAGDLEVALVETLRMGEADSAGLVTVFGGEDVDDESLERAADRVRAAFAGVEVEAVRGGQPVYPFIASIEE